MVYLMVYFPFSFVFFGYLIGISFLSETFDAVLC